MTPQESALRMQYLDARLVAIEARLAYVVCLLESKGDRIMITLNDIREAVAAQKTVVDSAKQLLADIHQKLVDATENNDPAKLQEVIDAIKLETADLAAAVEANTV
jgi:uncharacterized coiled-coil protein SlyX